MNVVISAATKGIGLALAKRFVKENHQVIICSSNQNNIQIALDTLNQIKPNQAFGIQVDLTQKEGVQTFIEYITNKWSQIDCLINNMGIYIPDKLIEKEQDTLPLMIEANLYSAYYLTKGLIQQIIETENSKIFNISSIAATTAYSGGSSYSISKYALNGFSVNLREELRDTHTRVCTVMPDKTFTSSWENQEINMDEFLMPEDVADIIYNNCIAGDAEWKDELLIKLPQ